MHASFAASESPWRSSEREVEEIARLLRSARLTVLHGSAGSGTTALLESRLLPHLLRRSSDRTVADLRREGSVVYLDERRADASMRDVVLYFDASQDAPLRTFSERVDAALFDRFGTPPDAHVPDVPFGWLAEKLGAASRESRVRFLVVLDAFDEHLAGAPENAARVLFTEELVETLNTPDLAVHVLAVVRDADTPGLQRFLERIAEGVAPPIVLGPPPSDRPRALRAVSPSAKTVPAAGPAFPDELLPTSGIAAAPVPEAGVAASPRVEVPDAVVASAPAPARPRIPRIAVALVALLCGAGVWLAASKDSASDRSREAVAARPDGADARSAAPAGAAGLSPATAGRPVLALAVDPDSALDARVAAQLRDRVAAAVGIDLRVRAATSWTDGFAAPSAGPQLSILRYDALQAARHGGVIAPLQVVMPLYAEPIQVLVRRDASIAFMHELEGRRINVGPGQGARAVTAARLYRELFGKPLPATAADVDDARTALAKLVAGDGVDALVVVGGELGALVAALPSDARARLKLLRLDQDDPASRRAQRTFLTTVARADKSGGLLEQDAPALAAMAFLVASGTFAPADDARLGELSRGLCEQLPALQRDGDPKWRETHAGARLDVGWPYAAAATDAFARCHATSTTAS